MSITNLILDIGNVICEWNPEALLASTIDDPAQRQAAYRYTIGHPDWLALDRGVMALDDAIERAVTRSGLPAEQITRLYREMPQTLRPIADTIDTIRAVHEAGISLFVLSNMPFHAWEYLARTHDFWSCFDGIVVSCEVGMIKPEPGIYEHLVNRFGVERSTSLFIDDMPQNITAAEAAGLQGRVLGERAKGGKLIRDLCGLNGQSGV